MVNQLNAEINKALLQPDVRERMAGLSFDTRPLFAAEFAAYVNDEVPKWSQAVKETGAKAD